jgi:hypothetical protein
MLGVAVDKQRTFDEFATIKAHENAFAPKIKMAGLKPLTVNDPLFG